MNNYVNKVIYGTSTLIDLTNDTITPETLQLGVTAHDASGASIVGVSNVPSMIAYPFSESVAYNIGDYVTYNGALYCFTSSHSIGVWNNSEVLKITVAEELDKKSNIGHIHDDRYYTESEIDTLLTTKADSTDLANYLPLAGGTMSGNLSLNNVRIYAKATGIDEDSAPSSTKNYAPYEWYDKDGNLIAHVELSQTVNNELRLNFGVRRYINSEWTWKNFYYQVASDGTLTYGFGSPSAVRNAIGASSGIFPVSVGGTGVSKANANLVFAGPSSGSAAAPTFRGLAAADIPNLNASKITDGTLAIARGGTSASTASANRVFAGPSSGDAAAPSFRALAAADIPSLNASKITAGTLPIGRGGTNATTADDAIVNLGGVKKSGDTMTDSLTIETTSDKGFYVKNTNITLGSAPSSARRLGGFAIRDKDGKNTGYYETNIDASGNIYGALVARNRYNNANSDNYLRLYSNVNGSKSISVSHPSAWRTALGFSLTRGSDSPSAVKVSHNTNTTISEINLTTAGLYILYCSANFASNANGNRRYTFLADSSNSNLGGATQMQVSPVNDAATIIGFTGIVNISSSTTYHLRAYQDSGGDLNVTARVIWLKIL